MAAVQVCCSEDVERVDRFRGVRRTARNNEAGPARLEEFDASIGSEITYFFYFL